MEPDWWPTASGLTIIESPYAGDRKRNAEYLARAVRHSLSLHEVPFASHGFYTYIFEDSNPTDRLIGIRLGYFFWPFAERVVFYIDYGMSDGMQAAQRRLNKSFPEMKTSMRRIGKNDENT